MAHFAKISEENEVLAILYMNNEDIVNADGVEVETLGQNHLEHHNNWPANLWIQASYNTHNGKYIEPDTGVEAEDQSKAFRGNYPQIGDVWDPENNIFIKPQPYPSWIKNVSEARWVSPAGEIPEVPEEKRTENYSGTHEWGYSWNETNKTWDLIDFKI
tara:strand:- start:158 stop:634 length:477 start_codon:yes stop_codon:yes gene_type:complete